MTPVALALGSNLGDRERTLAGALEALASSIAGLRVSTFHETDPVGVGEQPRFLNAAAAGRTPLSALDLLDRFFELERQYGRTRPHPGAPRTLDLDLILYGAQVIEEPDIQIPHLRFRDRLFVLQPLAEIAADWVDPVTGQTVGALLQLLQPGGSQD
ncbi:MAG: 2-amino-4-hydroxy-6-hydroxymethyldihydropteridine diphosphokinase [Acidobacteria bacterium]|nr:2-amino-4-hydroxy-6-hydroxymethyldihydropteridine diphosphokinase [Acidobacteriota bacterium]